MVNPAGPEIGKDKVLRGDSWLAYSGISEDAGRVSNRWYKYWVESHNVGFRCAKDATP